MPADQESASNKNPSQPNRRGFLGASALTAVGAAALGNVGIARGAHVVGSDELRIGLVGAGGRGTGAVEQLFQADGPVKLVAVADAFDYRVESCLSFLNTAAQKRAEELGKSPSEFIDVPKERQFVGLDSYKQVLQSDCHLIVLATPPGFRPEQFEAAVDAGKHIFMEKPVAVDGPGVRRVLEAGKKAKANGQAVAVGLQRRHQPSYIETIQRLQDGAIGDIHTTRVYWNGEGVWVRPRTSTQTELQYQVENWYYFNWICGDHIVEQHIHNLDVSNWLKKMTPAAANGMGGRQVRTSKECGQIFDHHFVEFTYPDGSLMLSQCRHISGAWSSVSEHAVGTKGSSDLSAAKIMDPDGKIVWRYKGKPENGHLQEQLDLVANLRKGIIQDETEYGAYSTMTAIMGRMATYSGKVVRWDEALGSQLSLAEPGMTWDSTPPVMPDDEGRYPVPVPGKSVVL